MVADIRSHEAAIAIHYLYNLVEGMDEGATICHELVEWTHDAFRYETEATFEDVLRHLYQTNCAATHAPAGLIYNRDLWARAKTWAHEIDDALWRYHSTTGENFRTKEAMTIGSLVWFAVEWFAQELASQLEAVLPDLIRIHRSVEA